MSGRVLLVIPAYREQRRLGGWLDELLPAMAPLPVDVLVVDDGSGEEETAAMTEIVEERRGEHPFLAPIKILPENRGKGGTIAAGWDEAGEEHDWLAFTDADGATPACEIARLLEDAIPAEPRTYFASRVKMLGRTIDRSLFRHLVGRVFATLVSEGLRIPVYDSQCGLKLLPKSAWLSIADSVEETGFAFDAELLAALLQAGEEVVEYPVDWHDVPGSKVRVLRDSIRMARSVMAIRRRHGTPSSNQTPTKIRK